MPAETDTPVHQISSQVPRGFRYFRTVDLTNTLNALEYQFRHPDGRLHVVRLRRCTEDLMLCKTFAAGRW